MAFNLVVNGTKQQAVEQIDKAVNDAHLNAALKSVVEAMLKIEPTGQVNFSINNIVGPHQALSAEEKRAEAARLESSQRPGESNADYQRRLDAAAHKAPLHETAAEKRAREKREDAE